LKSGKCDWKNQYENPAVSVYQAAEIIHAFGKAVESSDFFLVGS
jgi:hypothetical protein